MRGNSPLTIAKFLFFILFVFALSVRLYDLGAQPLSDSEAEIALQALTLVPGHGPVQAGAHAGYAALTGFLFFLFGDSNFIARLLPALAGAFLVMVPWLLRNRLGSVTALLMALGLAFDPLLVGISRQIGSPMLAVSFLVLAITLRIANDPEDPRTENRILVGVLAGLAAISGPSIWIGILLVFFTWLVMRASSVSVLNAESGEPVFMASREGLAFGMTLVLAGTLFLRFPQGLGSIGGSLSQFLLGWVNGSGTGLKLVLIGFGAYLGLPFLFGLVSMVRSRGRQVPLERISGYALMISLAVILLYPGRQVADLAWVAVPVWLLAASEISASFRSDPELRYRPAILAAVLVVLLTSFWTNLATLSNSIPQDPQFLLRMMVLLGTVLLAGLSVALVVMGWDTESAKVGLSWGFGFMLLMGLASGIWGQSAQVGQAKIELWSTSPGSGQEVLLGDSLSELGSWVLGESRGLDIVLTVEYPSAAWALRNYPNLQLGQKTNGDELPSIIVANTIDQDIRIASTYRGQGIPWRTHVLWGQMNGTDWMKWLLFREAPVFNEEIIFWARADLFLASGETVGDAFPLDSLDQAPSEEIIPLEDVEDVLPNE